MAKLSLDNNSPRTAFILGAALAGGDPLKAAQMLCDGTSDCNHSPCPHEEPMPRRCEVMFRGEEKSVVVDRYDYDSSTNALEVEWHFDGVPPEQHNQLNITDKEENDIIEQISESMDDDNSELDRYDYERDR